LTDGFAQPLVSLLSDFGLVDPFVAEMKAVILSVCPEVRIVDISHDVDRFSIMMGAFLLFEAAPYFPKGTVHVAVVDPGVGGSRRAIAIRTRRGIYVGPDNGLLIPAAQSDGVMDVFELTNRLMMGSEVSSTFHGRDIFAPAAAHLACGQLPEDCGPRITDYVTSPYGDPVFGKGMVTCEVLHVDRFGNVITNLRQAHPSEQGIVLGDKILFYVGRRRFSSRLVRTFSDLREGEVGAIFGSHGFLEIVAREKSAAEKLRLKRGAVVRLHLTG